MIPFDAVIFDMDNTLHDLHEARICAGDGVMAYKGKFSNLHFYSLNRDTPNLQIEAVTNYYQENKFDESIEEGIWLYHQLEFACMRPFSEMIKLVKRLKTEGKKLAVISNGDAKSTDIRIKNLELEGIFDIIVTPETFGVKKPNPEVYQKTLDFLKVSGNRTVMIGDKLNRDVLPAREAGIHAIHAWFGSHDNRDEIACAETPEDVERLLESFQI